MLVATLPLVRGSCIILLEDEISMWASLFWKVFVFSRSFFCFYILNGIKTRITTVFRVQQVQIY
jgi:hypothetical protein